EESVGQYASICHLPACRVQTRDGWQVSVEGVSNLAVHQLARWSSHDRILASWRSNSAQLRKLRLRAISADDFGHQPFLERKHRRRETFRLQSREPIAAQHDFVFERSNERTSFEFAREHRER